MRYHVSIYTGNGHTTTKISAGMAFLSHGVIAGGRIQYKQTWKVSMYIEAELKDKELNYSFDKIKEILENVYTVNIHHGNKLIKRTSSMNEEQKKIMNVFGCCHNQG